MTDLLRRLAARATGRSALPATAPLLPPRLGAERASAQRQPGPVHDDGDPPEEARPERGAVPRPAVPGRGARERRAGDSPPPDPGAAVAAADPRTTPAREVRSGADGVPPAAAPVADGAVAARRAGSGRAGAEQALPPGRRRAVPPPHTAVSVPAAEVTAVAPAGTGRGRPPAAAGGDGPPPGLRTAAARRAGPEPAARPGVRAVPVVVPRPGPAPVPLVLAPREPGLPGAAAGEAARDTAPVVTISIGRVEIRAVPPAGSPSGTTPEPAGSDGSAGGGGGGALALGDYLRGDRGER